MVMLKVQHSVIGGSTDRMDCDFLFNIQHMIAIKPNLTLLIGLHLIEIFDFFVILFLVFARNNSFYFFLEWIIMETCGLVLLVIDCVTFTGLPSFNRNYLILWFITYALGSLFTLAFIVYALVVKHIIIIFIYYVIYLLSYLMVYVQMMLYFYKLHLPKVNIESDLPPTYEECMQRSVVKE